MYEELVTSNLYEEKLTPQQVFSVNKNELIRLLGQSFPWLVADRCT